MSECYPIAATAVAFPRWQGLMDLTVIPGSELTEREGCGGISPHLFRNRCDHASTPLSAGVAVSGHAVQQCAVHEELVFHTVRVSRNLIQTKGLGQNQVVAFSPFTI